MRLNLKPMLLVFVAVMSIGAASSFASSPPVPANLGADSLSVYLTGQASVLLSEVRHEAGILLANAQTLGTLNHTITWNSHVAHLGEVKNRINAIGERLAELQRIRPLVSPGQRQAIDEVSSHALQVAASTEAAIAHLRENQGRTSAPEYRGHLTAIMGSSEAMKRAVDKFLDYERTQQRFQELQRELEL